MTNEEKLRLQAIDLYNQGEKVSEIARRIARSRQWVYTWINRYKEGNGHWNKSQSKAPHHPANKISQMMEDLVVETRIRLESSPYLIWSQAHMRYGMTWQTMASGLRLWQPSTESSMSMD